ncbi:unnamed protein product [Cylicocyclus nassatus]|uniref:Uncharacterized protein n=1 Tax=Cylicocyclus nassatus TaxID=53992 RepID=A0AA36H8C0_CYLNA|nr:unnamed protein product [Cylicocyclus nassatus]
MKRKRRKFLIERLLNAESTSEKGPQLEPSGSDFDTSAKTSAKQVESLLHKPISDIPAPVPSPATDLLLSELNDEEADELLAAGAEALNSTPSKSPARRAGGSAHGRTFMPACISLEKDMEADFGTLTALQLPPDREGVGGAVESLEAAEERRSSGFWAVDDPVTMELAGRR